ncbi:MAG: sulfite exporter TauE/SafE family protein [Pseudomonadota bacterium]
MITLVQYDWPIIALVLLTIAFSGFIHGAIGLGFPMISTPVIAVFLDVKTAIVLTLLPTVAVNIATIASASGFGSIIRSYGPMVAASLVGSIAGTYLLAISSPDPFRLMLAILIVVFLWSSYANRVPRAWLERFMWPAMVLFGLTAGFSGGTTNVMVAVLIIYFLALEIPRPTMVPAMNTCFLTGKLAQIGVLSLTGLVSWQLMVETAPLAVLAVVALRIGQRLQNRIPQATYRKGLHALLGALAVILLVQFALTS